MTGAAFRPVSIWSQPALLDVQRLYRFLATKNLDAAQRAVKAIRHDMLAPNATLRLRPSCALLKSLRARRGYHPGFDETPRETRS